MKYAVRSAPPPSGDAMEFVLSDNSVDRVGDVIEQNWELDNFRKTGSPALFNHDRDQYIGKWENVRVEGNRLVGKLKIAAEGTSALIDTVRKLLAQKMLRATSVGFQPLKMEKLNDEASEFWGPFRFLKSELLEVSLVSVPANPNAVSLARSMNLSPELIGTIFSKPANEARAAAPASLPKPTPKIRGNSMQLNQTLASRIDAAQKNVMALRTRLDEITSKDEHEQSEEEQQRADQLPDEVDAAEQTLQKLLRQERAISGGRREGAVAVQSSGDTSLEVVKQQRQQEIIRPGELSSAERERRPFGDAKKVDDGDYVFRSLATWFSSHVQREPIEMILRSRYGDRDERMNAVLRAAVNPAMTTVAGWAAELVQTQNAAAINRILAKAIYTPLANRGVRYTFGPGISQLKIPIRTGTSKLAGAWVGEGSPKPVKRASFSTATLTPHKLATITTFTEEMAQYSNPAIEAILRQGLQDDTSEALDAYLIDNIASSASRPAGLLNGVTPLTATASGTTTEKMVADLKQLISAIVAAGGGTDIVMLINPAQSISLGFAMTTTGDFLFATVTEAGQKFNVTFIVSQTVTAGTVIAIEASEFATATGDAPRFAVSNEATLHEEDTTPLAIGTPGAPATVAAPVRSLFQTDSIAIRLTLYVTWVMRRTGMVQTIAAVGW
jgi:HK97 family phage major capsid protein/HK97 family phage prohead protease